MFNPALRKIYDSMAQRVKPEAMDTFRALCRLPVADSLLEEAHREKGRADAADLPYTATQLEYVFEQAIEARYPDLPFVDQGNPILPWNTQVPRGARTWTQHFYDGAGEAVFVGFAGDGDIPYVTLIGASTEGRIENIAIGYGYSRRELRAAAFVGDNLDARKGKIAQRAHGQKINDIAAWGAEALGIKGFFNHPNIAIMDAADKAAAGDSTSWDVATAAEILADVNALLGSVPDNSNEMYKATDVLLPGTKMRILEQRMLSSDGNNGVTTIIEMVRKSHPGVTFRECNDLKAANSLGNLTVDAMVAYIRGGEFGAELVIPGGMYFEQYPPQEDGLHIKIPCESEVGGVKLEHPLGVVRMDGI